MSENSYEQSEITARAEFVLKNVDLSWSDIEQKDILDIGSGESALAQEATRRGSTARITSLDRKVEKNWLGLPGQVKKRLLQAEGEALPFSESSFDYAIMHGSAGSDVIPEAVRVLRPGGELRMAPLAGMLLEYWNISYYLDKVKGRPQQEIVQLLEDFDRRIEEADGWLPNEYVKLRKVALDTLSQPQKIKVIEMMVKRYSQVLNLSFSFKVDDPSAREPNALLIYKKPE